MKLKSFLIFLFAISIIACNRNTYYEYIDPIPIGFKTLTKSSFFKDDYITLTVDSLDNTLYFSLSIKANNNIPYPINTTYKDTLTRTAFNFDFYYNNQLLTSDYKSINNTLRWKTDTTETKNKLCVISDTTDFEDGNSISFKMPLHAFHNLKSGKRNIRIKVYQTLFTDECYVKTDSTSRYQHLYADKKLFETEIEFDITVPKIYKSKLIGFGLELKNDSTFSPSGMDNTIWNSSYPDIYWAVFYPKTVLYAQTEYQKSTDRYEGKDTFTLYHYTPHDTVGIGVYDHDNLSRDDGLGYWTGSINYLERKLPRRISFDAIKWMDLKLIREGVVN